MSFAEVCPPGFRGLPELRTFGVRVHAAHSCAAPAGDLRDSQRRLDCVVGRTRGCRHPQPAHRATASRAHRCRPTARPDELATPTRRCAPRHRDFLSNGYSVSCGPSPCPRAPSLDATHGPGQPLHEFPGSPSQFTLSISKPVRSAAASSGSAAMILICNRTP